MAMVEMGAMILVAPFPSMPTPCPMNIWSTMLYRALTTMDKMPGIANPRKSLPALSVPSGLGAACVWLISTFPLSYLFCFFHLYVCLQ